MKRDTDKVTAIDRGRERDIEECFGTPQKETINPWSAAETDEEECDKESEGYTHRDSHRSSAPTARIQMVVKFSNVFLAPSVHMAHNKLRCFC